MRGQSFSSFVISATIALVSGVGAGVAVTAVVVVVFVFPLGVQLTAPIATSAETSAICVKLSFFIDRNSFNMYCETSLNFENTLLRSKPKTCGSQWPEVLNGAVSKTS